MLKKILTCLILFCSTQSVFSVWDEKSIEKVEKVVEEVRETWDVPAIAVGVIHGDSKEWVKGFGTSIRGADKPVNGTTLFQIASLSKAFTSLLLLDELKKADLTLDTPVIEVLPYFKLQDEFITNACSFEDLLTHRSGLAGITEYSWCLWWHTNRTEGELIGRTASMPLTNTFRKSFAYNNTAYLICGEGTSLLASKPWKDLAYDNIFQPLGMHRTTVDQDVLHQDGNVARPHLNPKVKQQPIDHFDWTHMLPAGGIISCVEDLLLWIKYCMHSELVREALNPKNVFDPKGLFRDDEMPFEPLFSHECEIVNYGLGWMSYTLGDVVWYYHTGITDGEQSMLIFSPQEKFGVVVLTNESPQPACPIIINTIIDAYLDRKETDWNEFAKDCLLETIEVCAKKEEQINNLREKDKAPKYTFSNYSGVYEHPAYGQVQVMPTGKLGMYKVKWLTGDIGALSHWGGEEYKLELEYFSAAYPWIVTFDESDGKVSSLSIPPIGSFKKK